MSFPIQPIYLFADSQLLFWQKDGEPFLKPMRDAMGKEKPKAAYIGASNQDQRVFYSIFEGAMDQIGITERHMIRSEYPEYDREFLADADLILLAGGDVAMGWDVLEETGMRQEIIQRYYAGAVLMGVSAGAVQLGLHGWKAGEDELPEKDDIFDTFKLIPFIIDAHDEANQWQRLKAALSYSDSLVKGIGIPTGGGLIYHPDHTVEPIRHSLTEFSIVEKEIVQTLLFPPGDDEVAEDVFIPEIVNEPQS